MPDLDRSRGKVVHDGKAEDMLFCGFYWNIRSILADHDTQFDLVVQLFVEVKPSDDRLAVSEDVARSFAEVDGVTGLECLFVDEEIDGLLVH